MEIRSRPVRHRRRGPSCLIIVLILVVLVGMGYAFANRREVVSALTPDPTATPTQSPANLVLRARLFIRDGEFANAIAAYEQVIEILPDDVRNYIALIDLLVQQGEAARALELAEQAVTLSPDDDAVWTARAAAHIAYAEQLSNQARDDGPEYARAVEAGRAATRLNPNNARAYAYTAAGLIRQGLDFLGPAQELAENALRAMEIGMRDRGEQADPIVLYYYAEVLTYQGYYDTALDRLEQAIALNDRFIDAYIALARVYFFYRNENLYAINLLEDALELAPNDAELLDTLAYFEIIIGNYADAEEYARMAVEADDTMVRAHARLGHAYYRNFNYPEAIDQLEIATTGYGRPDTNTSVYFAMLGLAYYYENVDNCTVALPLLERALAASVPGSPGELSALEGLDLCRQVQINQP